MIAFVLAVALQEAPAFPKIAEIESVSGGVQLIDTKGAARAPTKFGRRIKNGDVRDEDRIKTGEGAQAVIVFPDRSRYTLKEKSEVQILQKNLPKPTEEGQTVGRRIRLLFGDLVSDVMPNKDVHTDFETPAGSAAVRGTLLRLSVGAVSFRLETVDGTVRYFNEKFATTLDVARGQRVRFVNGSLVIEIENDAGRPLLGRIGTRTVRFDNGDRVIVREPKGDGPNLRVDVDTGPLDVDGAPTSASFEAPPGAGVGAESRGFDPRASTGQPVPDGVPIVPEGFPGALDTTGQLPNASDLLPSDSNTLSSSATNVATSEAFSDNSVLNNSGTLMPIHPNDLEHDIAHEWDALAFLFGEIHFHKEHDTLRFFDPASFDLEHGALESGLKTAHDQLHTSAGLAGYFQSIHDQAHTFWHQAHDPSFIASHHDAFHLALADFDASTKALAAQAASGSVPSFHDYHHVKLDDFHAHWHLENDSTPDPFWSFDHDSFHATLLTDHDKLHTMAPHDFLHDQLTLVHDAWHVNMSDTGCFDFTSPGPCKDAHDHFHSMLDQGHDLEHKIFGF